MSRAVVLMIAFVALAGCGQGARSYEWFKTNPDAATKVVAACGTRRTDDCVNAERASADTAYEQRRDHYHKAF